MDTKELSIEVRNRAGNYFREGYNCSEAIFLTFREFLAPDLDHSAVRLFTPLGGGLGRSGCLCGALNGASVILGARTGRTKPDREIRQASYNLVNDFHGRFREKFGSTCCRVLNKEPFDTPEQGRTCLKIIGGTAMLLMDFIQEKGLIVPEY